MDIYQQKIMDHYKKPRYRGTINNPTHISVENNSLCGDRIEFQLSIKRKKIIQAVWQGEGCVLSLAAADVIAEHIQKIPLNQVSIINEEWLLGELGVKPSPSRLKCVLLPLIALKKALTNN